MIDARIWLLTCLVLSAMATALPAQKLVIPRAQDKPPGPALSPEEAVAKMTVPEGFTVEVVAAEPDVVNPVAMTIDEKGRFWITESFEYPRKEAGPGRDRVKVLEDTDGDGKVDKTTVFAEGLNIPSGIAVGYGGVWVANSPDILFMQDTDGDLKADKIETVVTGFGRTDTHELPNSLTWGPDGWLYGLNGVFNYSHVKYAESNPNYKPDQPGWEFTCAMFRIHPRTREFQIFAQGTSNPWGIAFNDEGEAFVSACVIDHLWHIVETGYYIRQGGPYPPHTWPMRSIVDYKHQKAAYCGITWFDSDAYPTEYRGVLYMGNIHGGCINADIAERAGSTYKGRPHPGFPAKPGAFDNPDNTIAKIGEGADAKLADFLTANDAWFMPVVQKTGPDGCLYILDWYDRYHCYQDANADPAGIERAKGRLYRVRYKDTPHAQPFDLAKESDDQLIERLADPNVYYRETAQRLLSERADPKTAKALEGVVRDSTQPTTKRLHALWALAGVGPLEDRLLLQLIEREQSPLQQWGIRLAGNKADVGVPVEGAFLTSVHDGAPPTILQSAIAFPKLTTSAKYVKHIGGMRINYILTSLLYSEPGDPMAQHIAWQNLKSLIQSHPSEVVDNLCDSAKFGFKQKSPLISHTLEMLLDESDHKSVDASTLLKSILAEAKVETSVQRDCLDLLADRSRHGTLHGAVSERLFAAVQDSPKRVLEKPELRFAVATLLAMSGDSSACDQLLTVFSDDSNPMSTRIDAIQTLIAAHDERVLTAVQRVLGANKPSSELQGNVIESLARLQDDSISSMLIKAFPQLGSELQPKAVEVLTQRPEWSIPLLKAIQNKQIDKDVLNLNQLKRVASFKNDELQELVLKTYGAVRSDRRTDRQQVIKDQRNFLLSTPGDAERGQAAFKKVCGQCHKIYGEGAEVGPDITRNGRNDWNQLLQNVFDPSAVIGPGYQARVLVTADGRVLTGLPVEESDQRVVLKIQGGKTETIPRDQIDEYAVSEVSLMPEQLEKQLTSQELADLFAFLALDKPPSDPSGRLLPGAPSR